MGTNKGLPNESDVPVFEFNYTYTSHTYSDFIESVVERLELIDSAVPEISFDIWF